MFAGADQLTGVFAEALRQGVAAASRERRVGPLDEAVAVGDEDGVVGALQRRALQPDGFFGLLLAGDVAADADEAADFS
ncbi:MAG: hypothetical protein WCF18_21245, partial [Chthoniobacteraceae bacterium]